MALALFDLDHTLLGGDSDHAWGVFLAELGVLDVIEQTEQQDYFYHQYQAGELDIDAFLRFQLKPLAEHSKKQLLDWRQQYIDTVINDYIESGNPEIIEPHRDNGDELVIITATNNFITEPIAERLRVPTLLATQVEIRNGNYTGTYTGTPCFKDGKITVLKNWLASTGRSFNDFDCSYFYSDSINDLPLLLEVDHPVAVRPDEKLRTYAVNNNWNIID